MIYIYGFFRKPVTCIPVDLTYGFIGIFGTIATMGHGTHVSCPIVILLRLCITYSNNISYVNNEFNQMLNEFSVTDLTEN